MSPFMYTLLETDWTKLPSSNLARTHRKSLLLVCLVLGLEVTLTALLVLA